MENTGWISLPAPAPASSYITEPAGEGKKKTAWQMSCFLKQKDSVKAPGRTKPPRRSGWLGQGAPQGGTHRDSIKSIKHLSL